MIERERRETREESREQRTDTRYQRHGSIYQNSKKMVAVTMKSAKPRIAEIEQSKRIRRVSSAGSTKIMSVVKA
jgi:hypothetical protein